MGTTCRCGTKVQHPYDHMGCIQCGAPCCPACSYELESVSYCANCAEALLDLPWAAALNPGRPGRFAEHPEENAMTPTCECALLHEASAGRRGCRECGITCCPSCAVEIETHTYCRWCALVLAPAISG